MEARKRVKADDPTQRYKGDEVIGSKYRLTRLLGAGGMSWVWLAENIDLQAEVAIKLIRHDVEEDTVGDRLLGEARTIARLGHRAIVRVFDFGTTEFEDPFIVMELLKGETLGQHLARVKKVPAVQLGRTLLPIIDALHEAHKQGVVHRDLKPDNIMLAQTDAGIEPKLLDFGIAKLKRDVDSVPDPKLTRIGTVVGSPDYMSPEQARGDADLDGRSDVFALAVLMYECLTGVMPFTGESYNSIMWAIIDQQPKPIREYGVHDEGLWALLEAGLAKDRERRWQSARAFGEALAGWLEAKGVYEDICSRSLRASWLPNDGATPAAQPITIEPLPELSLADVEKRHNSLRPIAIDEPNWRSGMSWERLTSSKLGVGLALGAVLLLVLLFSFMGGEDAPETAKDSAEPESATAAVQPAPGEVGWTPVEKRATKATVGTEDQEPTDSEARDDSQTTIINLDSADGEGADEEEAASDTAKPKARVRRAPKKAPEEKAADPFDFGF